MQEMETVPTYNQKQNFKLKLTIYFKVLPNAWFLNWQIIPILKLD